MMNLTNAELALASHYQKQAAEYERILELVIASRLAMENGDATDESLGQVHELIQATHERDQAMTSMRDAWASQGAQAGQDLAQVLKRVEALVRRILEIVAEAESLARQAKARLLPQMTQETTARRMHRAYATASSQSGRP